MLQPYKDLIENGGESIPAIPKAVIDYLQTIYSASYQHKIGSVESLRKAGNSDSYVLGYLAGLEAASAYIDQSVAVSEDYYE